MNTAWEALKASQRKGPPLSLEEMRRVSMGHEETRTAGQSTSGGVRLMKGGHGP